MPSVEMAYARTAERGPGPAAEDLCKQLGSAKPKLVVMFASREDGSNLYANMLEEGSELELPSRASFHCSGEIHRRFHINTTVTSPVLGASA